MELHLDWLFAFLKLTRPTAQGSSLSVHISSTVILLKYSFPSSWYRFRKLQKRSVMYEMITSYFKIVLQERVEEPHTRTQKQTHGSSTVFFLEAISRWGQPVIQQDHYGWLGVGGQAGSVLRDQTSLTRDYKILSHAMISITFPVVLILWNSWNYAEFFSITISR